MTDRRQERLSKLYGSSASVEEKVLTQLTVERICADMCDFYENFYANAGPGAMVYAPNAEKESDSMFFLAVDQLIAAQDDFRNKEMDGPADVMQKAITRAESINPSKEALFIINDKEHMALIVYNRERPLSGPITA
jgi:hypothetical protein